MAESVTSHARWIGRAVSSGLVAAATILITQTLSNSQAQTVTQTTATPGTAAAPAPAAASAPAPKLNAQQLDALTAPIALYPDALLAQVLMATTFPDEVSAAAAWSKQNAKLSGDEAVRAVASMPWDPSVQSLVAFPQALATMAQKPDWVHSIGQAFLAQPSDVMDSVQRLRNAAYKAGNLTNSSQQKVIVQPPAAASTTTNTIVIEPANPQVVYVPTYNPTVVYGAWPYPAYPPVYMPPPPGYVFGTALVSGLAFGAGIAITNSLWGGCDWGHNDVNVNVNRYNNINVNHRIDANRTTANWDRSAAAANRNRGLQNNLGQNNLGQNGGVRNGALGANAAADRSAFRGRDDAQRERAEQTLSQRTGQNFNEPASARVQNIRQGGTANDNRLGGPDSTRRDVGGRAQDMNRDNALRDAGNGGASRQDIARGQQSHEALASRGNPGAGSRASGAGLNNPGGRNPGGRDGRVVVADVATADSVAPVADAATADSVAPAEGTAAAAEVAGGGGHIGGGHGELRRLKTGVETRPPHVDHRCMHAVSDARSVL